MPIYIWKSIIQNIKEASFGIQGPKISLLASIYKVSYNESKNDKLRMISFIYDKQESPGKNTGATRRSKGEHESIF